MRILSWNVNGLRACEKKGFSTWLAGTGADVVGLQEVRATVDQLPAHLQAPDGWHAHWVSAERKGYSGVGLLSRCEPDSVETSLGDERFDLEGRLQIARFGRLVLANVYFPNGSGRRGTTVACRSSSISTARSSTACSGCDAAVRGCW